MLSVSTRGSIPKIGQPPLEAKRSAIRILLLASRKQSELGGWSSFNFQVFKACRAQNDFVIRIRILLPPSLQDPTEPAECVESAHSSVYCLQPPQQTTLLSHGFLAQ